MATSGVTQNLDTNEQIEAKLELARKRLADLQYQQMAEKFVAANPSYEANPDNQRAMQDYLRANDFEPTYEGLELAYGRLKTQGRITMPLGVEDKPTVELTAYQRELQERVRRAQEEIERGQRQMSERPAIMPANQYLQQQRQQAQTRQPVTTMPLRVPTPVPVVETPTDKLRKSLRLVDMPSGRRVKNAIID